jgi:hypothetical protein
LVAGLAHHGLGPIGGDGEVLVDCLSAAAEGAVQYGQGDHHAADGGQEEQGGHDEGMALAARPFVPPALVVGLANRALVLAGQAFIVRGIGGDAGRGIHQDRVLVVVGNTG